MHGGVLKTSLIYIGRANQMKVMPSSNEEEKSAITTISNPYYSVIIYMFLSKNHIEELCEDDMDAHVALSRVYRA